MAESRALARPFSEGAAAVRRRPRARDALLWTLAVLTLLAVFGPSLLEHRRHALEPGVYNNDARQQIYPFFRYEDPSLFPADYAGDYYLAFLPIGYRALYAAAALGPGAEALSDSLPYLLVALTAAALAAAAHRFGGIPAAFTAAALCLGGALLLARMSSGLPRAFGFPIAALALAALVRGRSRVLAAVVVLGAAFYPAAAMPAGMALAGWMLLPSADRGDASGWSFRRRAALVALTALVSTLLLMPSLLAARSYGPTIRADQRSEFPEAGPGGRYSGADAPPYPAFAPLLRQTLELGVPGRGEPLTPISAWRSRHPRYGSILLWSLLGVAALGWVGLLLQSSAARRASLLPIAAFLGHGAASLVAPLLYLPQRYVLFPMLMFAFLVLGAGVAGLVPTAATGAKGSGWLRPAAVGVFCAALLVVFGGRGSTTVGLDVHVDPDDGVFRFLGTLPPDALIAGWPTGVLDDVPSLTRRQVLLTYETHQAFHAGYVLEMRRRMETLVDAYLAPASEGRPEALLRLHRELGVSHLLIAVPALRARALRYFRPFDADIARAIADSDGGALEALAPWPGATVYDDGRYRVLDLRRLAEPTLGLPDPRARRSPP